MTADPTHRHDEFHRGQVPTGQLADGTASLGFVGISNGDGSVTWGARSAGGGGSCEHQHVADPFTAAGATPETFTLSRTPLGDRRVYVNGLRAWPADVGGTGTSVEVDTAAADQVVVDYEAECAAVLAWPGTDMVLGGDHQNVLATFVTTGPAALVLDLTTIQNSGGAFTDHIAVMNATDTYSPSGSPSPPDGVISPTVGVYYIVVEGAGTWYVVGTYGGGSFVSDLTGAGTYTLIEPSTPTGSLTFPGSSDITVQNELVSTSTAGPVVIFITIDSDLPNDYSLGAYGSTSGDRFWYVSGGIPFPAGTYVYITDSADATLQLYAYLAGSYDGGLTDTGTYEVVPL